MQSVLVFDIPCDSNIEFIPLTRTLDFPVVVIKTLRYQK